MLQKATVGAAVPAQDLARAKAFYADTLGLTPTEEDEGGITYECGAGSRFLLFASSGASDGSFTQIAFEVDDLDAAVAELRGHGARFLDYDTPTFKTENGIATLPNGRGGWLKDSEGNLISVFQRVAVAAAS